MGTNWIASELRRLHPNRFHAAYYDLNDNGKPDKGEWIKRYNNNNIPGNDRNVIGDAADWLAFYRKNARRLNRLGGLFKYARRIKTTSPLHLVMLKESPLANWREIATAYDKAGKTLRTFNWALRSRRIMRITAAQRKKLRELPASQRGRYGYAFRRLNAMFYAMRRRGLLGTVKGRRQPLFIKDMAKGGALGYTASTYLMLALAHEKGYPVYAVRVPNNLFVRWDAKNVKINADQGSFHDDAYYVDQHSLTKAFQRARRLGHKKPYLRTLKSKGFLAIVMRMVGEGYYRKQRYAEADKLLTLALTYDKNYVRAYNKRGMARYMAGNAKGAIDDFREAIRLNPEYGNAYYTLAIAYRLGGKPFKAIVNFTEALKRLHQKHHASIYYRRSKAYYDAGNFLAARGDAERVIKLDPDKDFAHRQLGTVYFAQQKYDLAIRHLKRSLAKDGSEAKTLFILGRTYFIKGKYSVAKSYYDKALRKDPKNHIILRHRAMASYRLKKFRAAVVDCKRALRVDGKDSEAWRYSSLARKSYAMKLWRRGDRRESRKQMKLSRSELRKSLLYGSRATNTRKSGAAYPHVQALLNKATQETNALAKFRHYRSAYRAYKKLLRTDPGNAAWIRLQMKMLSYIMKLIWEKRL